MKYPIILLFILFSCQKQEVKQKSVEIIDNNIPLVSNTYPAVWATGTTYSCLTQNDHQHLLTKLGSR